MQCDETRQYVWVAEDSAGSAEAVSLVFFVVVLGHGGVDLHGVVVAILVAMCAWLHDAGSWSRSEWSIKLGCGVSAG